MLLDYYFQFIAGNVRFKDNAVSVNQPVRRQRLDAIVTSDNIIFSSYINLLMCPGFRILVEVVLGDIDSIV